MRIAFYSILLILIVGLIAACNPQREAPSLLRDARQLAENNPDSAMRLIDSIAYPEESLNKEQYMQYLATRVQVRHKNYLDIAKDTSVFEATAYFTDLDKDPRQIALAQFYSGCVRRQQKQYEQAMVYYKDAERYAEKTGDRNLLGLITYNIGDLLSEQGLHTIALERYKAAAIYYQEEPDKHAHSYSAIGRMFLFVNEMDSAFYYFYRGLDIAREKGSNILQSQLTQSLGVAYEEIENYVEAERYLREAMQLTSDSTKLPRHYLNFAVLYRKSLQTDSAQVYVQKLKATISKLPDHYFQVSALSFLADWEKVQANYDSAFAYQGERMEVLAQIMEDRKNESVYEAERRYNYEHIQAQHYRAQSVRQRWIIVLLGLLIISGTFFMWYRARQKNRRIEIQRNIDTLTEMNRELEHVVQQKRSDLRKALLWRFDIAKKVMKLNAETGNGEQDKSKQNRLIARFNHIVYGETTIDEQWEMLLQTFKKARPGYAEKIQDNHPDLTATEFRICVLTYADFSIKEIAVVLQQSPNTIQTRRTTLRKKLGIVGGGNIAEYIDTMLG